MPFQHLPCNGAKLVGETGLLNSKVGQVYNELNKMEN